ncbi:MAG: hypothetical protein DMF88_05370 [Acidobacteria bacterium]|nr:MAG: hypothetical protein DMF88_05370 [Acidobacteriota bacterium]
MHRPTSPASTWTTRFWRSTISASVSIVSRIDSSNTRQYKAGDKVTFLVARREQLMRIPVTFATEPSKGWRLDISPSATDTQRRMFDAWLRS